MTSFNIKAITLWRFVPLSALRNKPKSLSIILIPVVLSGGDIAIAIASNYLMIGLIVKSLSIQFTILYLSYSIELMIYSTFPQVVLNYCRNGVGF